MVADVMSMSLTAYDITKARFIGRSIVLLYRCDFRNALMLLVVWHANGGAC